MARLLKHSAFLFLLIIVFSCKENSSEKNQAFISAQKESIKQNLKQLDDLKYKYSGELQNNSDRNQFEAKLYFKASQKYLDFLDEFELRIKNLKIADTLNLNKYYTEKINEVSAYTDSIKAIEGLKLFPQDKEILLFANRSDLKINPSGNYELLRLLYLQDFKSQILNAVGVVHPIFGCLRIRYPMFYDFMIIQNNIINEKSYTISIKNDYMYHYIEKYYFITFKSLKKITANDTILINKPITLHEQNKVFKTTDILYEKGKYLLTININVKLPSGLIKADEMNFEYELK